jgi:hypothetical protein
MKHGNRRYDQQYTNTERKIRVISKAEIDRRGEHAVQKGKRAVRTDGSIQKSSANPLQKAQSRAPLKALHTGLAQAKLPCTAPLFTVAQGCKKSASVLSLCHSAEPSQPRKKETSSYCATDRLRDLRNRAYQPSMSAPHKKRPSTSFKQNM